MQQKRRKPTRRDDAGVRLRRTTEGGERSTRESREAARAARSATSAEDRAARRKVRKKRAPVEADGAQVARSRQDARQAPGRHPRPKRQKRPEQSAQVQATDASSPAEERRDPRDQAVLQTVLKQQERRKGGSRRMLRQIGLGVAALLALALVLFGISRGISAAVKWIYTSGQPKQELVEEEKLAAEPVQVDLVMIGDILQHMGVYESGFADDGTRNYDHIFAHIGSELEGADIKVVNQETLLGGEALGFSGYPSFNGPQEMGDAEVKAGFNVVLRATNHALDYGYEGLSSEMSYWHTQHPEVAVLGAVDPNDATASVDDLYIYEKDGFKIALLNYTYDLNGYVDERGVVSTLDAEHVRATVTAAEQAADLVVVFPHWGEEYNLEPVADQYEMANLMIECGADLIIGGHPHVIEPVEMLTASDGHKVPCFWSVGNFISTQVDNESLVGGIAKVTMVKDADGTCSVTACSFVPTVTKKGIGTDMTTYLLRDYTDDLAATNYLYSNGTDNTSLTVAWANEFCQQVLGSGFDTASEQLVFGPEALKAEVSLAPIMPSEGETDTESASDTAETADVAEGEGAEATPIQVG